MRKRVVVGVIGGGYQPSIAFGLGYAIASSGNVLLTGGAPVPGDETKDRAMCGAVAAENDSLGVARLIGVLDSTAVQWATDNPFRLLLWSGLSSFERDAINGVTPDVIIALRGSVGTLCETAFAAAVGRPIMFLDSLSFLVGNYSKRHTRLVYALNEAARCYPRVGDRFTDAGTLEAALLSALCNREQEVRNPTRSLDLIVADAVSLARRHGLGSGRFPGLPSDTSGSVARFEELFSRIVAD